MTALTGTVLGGAVSALTSGPWGMPVVPAVQVPVSVAAQTVLDGSLLLAVPLAVLAGLVSFASPCVLPLLPGYLAYVSGLGAAGPTRPLPARAGAASAGTAAGRSTGGTQATPGTTTAGGGGVRLADPASVSRRRLLAGATLFVAGFSVVFVLLGTVAGVAGAVLPRARTVDVVAGAAAVGLGLVFVGGVPWLSVERRPRWRPAVGLAGAPLLGAAFGVGWVPCVGPTLGAVLLLAGTEGGGGRGALLAASYCAGLGVPFLLVSLSYARALAALEPLRRHRVLVNRVGGAMLVLIGVLLITGAWGQLVDLLRAPIARFPVLL
ncbi:cytochrome c biogenesis CcdA family protein [Aquipuribacter hungaricus]|uniref:cytochrome c biogenesis CcdA family protein n=1 Tax=Aquipuribacter hungaricus TaxID=545624 RepID=UPI0036200505